MFPLRRRVRLHAAGRVLASGDQPVLALESVQDTGGQEDGQIFYDFRPFEVDTGEGRWLVEPSQDTYIDVPEPVVTPAAEKISTRAEVLPGDMVLVLGGERRGTRALPPEPGAHYRQSRRAEVLADGKRLALVISTGSVKRWRRRQRGLRLRGGLAGAAALALAAINVGWMLWAYTTLAGL